MSKAEELLNSSSVAVYSSDNVETEPHIVIDKNRNVTVPDELKRIAVQHDHMIETVTFDCPRYWDKHDMSKMYIYVNYMRADGEKGSDLATNVTIDETDDSIMHFDWTITGHLSAIQGNIVFLVCTQKMADDGTAKNHWNSELNTDMYVSEGLEVDSDISAVYPGIITQLLTRMDNVDSKTTDDAMAGYVDHYINNSQTSVESIVNSNLAANGGTYFGNYMDTDPTGADLMQDCVNEHLNANFERYFEYTNLHEVVTWNSFVASGNYNENILDPSKIDALEIGDSWAGATSYFLSGYSDCYTVYMTLGSDFYVDFTNATQLPSIKSPLTFKIIVISKNSSKVIDIVTFDELTDNPMLKYSEEVIIAYSSGNKPNMTTQGSNVMYEIRSYINFSDLQDIPQMKEDIKSVNNPIVDTFYGSDVNWKNYYLHGIDQLSAGDVWLGFSGYLTTTNNDWYVLSMSMLAGQTIDFSNGILPKEISDGYGVMIVTKNSNPSYVADVIDFDTLATSKTYYCSENCVVYYCSEINYEDGDVIFNVRQTTDYQAIAEDIVAMKADIEALKNSSGTITVEDGNEVEY